MLPALAPEGETVTETALQLHVRWMIRRDMPEVLDIDLRSFQQTWTEDDFTQALRKRYVIGLVVETIGGPSLVVGHVIYELRRNSLQLLRLAVSPEHRRRGVGRRLVHHLTNKLSSHRRNTLEVHVPERLLEAQLFFHHCGLRAASVLRGHCGEQDDAYLMRITRKNEP